MGNKDGKIRTELRLLRNPPQGVELGCVASPKFQGMQAGPAQLSKSQSTPVRFCLWMSSGTW